MSRWFRHYAGMARDEKLVRVALKAKQTIERVAWVWSAILESAAEIDDDGRYELDEAEAAHFLRTKDSHIRSITAELERHGRVFEGRVVKWSDRQFKSDRSAERVRAHREQKRSAPRVPPEAETLRNGDVTLQKQHCNAPETETELEAEKEGSEAVASGAVTPIAEPVYTDAKHQLWAEGTLTLMQLGLSEDKARSMIGKWCKDTGNDFAGVMTAIQQARDQRPPGGIVGWITQALPTKANHERNRQTRPASGPDALLALLGEYRDPEPDGTGGEAGAAPRLDAQRTSTGGYRC